MKYNTATNKDSFSALLPQVNTASRLLLRFVTEDSNATT